MNDFHIKRLFVALPLDDVAKADVADLMAGVDLLGIRRTRTENLHVTVKFLGDVEDTKIPDVIEAMRHATDSATGFELNAVDVRLFPTPARPRVLALSLDCPQALSQLFERLERRFMEIGFRAEGRAYHPHVTMGRFRKPPRGIADISDALAAPIAFDVNRIMLMQSILGPDGPTYVKLAEMVF